MTSPNPRPRISTLFLAEWILTLAVGFAVAQAVLALYRPMMSPNPVGWYQYLMLIEPTLAGVALLQGALVAAERLRRKGPSLWGLGRWTWFVCALYIVFHLGFHTWLFISPRFQGGSPQFWAFYTSNLAALSADLFRSRFIWALIAGWVGIKLARWPLDPNPDAREWSGRIFMMALVAWTLCFAILTKIMG